MKCNPEGLRSSWCSWCPKIPCATRCTCTLQGEVTEVEKDAKLAMKWRFSSWEDGCFSNVSGALWGRQARRRAD